jgi:cobyrinic acid a,c-diamide synthase
MTDNKNKVARGLVVAGLSGGSGKSVVAVGLAAAMVRRGWRLVPFKKGPDYIDAGWLALAAGWACYNLDPYLMDQQTLQKSFYRQACSADMALIEGNRGLFDGVDVSGSCSTAELSIGLRLPVLLVVDCTKTTRTVAALVLGCLKLDERVRICGVVLNRTAGSRHRSIVREAVEKYTGVPVLGALPKVKEDIFAQRHLGITPFQEHGAAATAVNRLAGLMEEHLDLDRLLSVAAPLDAAKCEASAAPIGHPSDSKGQRARIGLSGMPPFSFITVKISKPLRKRGPRL